MEEAEAAREKCVKQLEKLRKCTDKFEPKSATVNIIVEGKMGTSVPGGEFKFTSRIVAQGTAQLTLVTNTRDDFDLYRYDQKNMHRPYKGEGTIDLVVEKYEMKSTIPGVKITEQERNVESKPLQLMVFVQWSRSNPVGDLALWFRISGSKMLRFQAKWLLGKTKMEPFRGKVDLGQDLSYLLNQAEASFMGKPPFSGDCC